LGSEQVKDKPKVRAFLSLLRGKWTWLANSIWSVSLLGDNRLTVCGLCNKIPGNKMVGNSVDIQRREKGKRAIAAWMWKWEFVENFARYWLNTLSVKGAVKKNRKIFPLTDVCNRSPLLSRRSHLRISKELILTLFKKNGHHLIAELLKIPYTLNMAIFRKHKESYKSRTRRSILGGIFLWLMSFNPVEPVSSQDWPV